MQQSNQEEEDNTMYAVTTVTDNDDDVPESTTASANNTALLEQDRLRIAAEKRRQKILNQANTRMSIVEGTYSSSISTPVVTTTTEDTGATTKTDDEDVVPVTDTDGTEPLVVGESSTDTSTTEAVTSSSTTTSSKLAAMRRRRFQKKAAPTATEEEPDTTTVLAHTTTTTIASSTTTTSIGDDPKSTTTSTTEIEDAGAATEPMMDTPLVTGTTERVTEPGTDDVPTTTTTTTNKKYLGVAKMRRRMIKERHEQQQQQDGNTTLEDVAGNDTTSTISSHPQTRRTKWITTLPILTYVMTTFVLFGTGLHVGLQQSNVQYCYYNSKVMMVPDPDHEPSADGYCYNTNDDPEEQQWSLLVHSEFAPRQPMGGLHRLLSTVVGPVVQSIPIRNVPVDAAAVSSQPPPPQDHDDTEDEFSSTVPTVQRMQSNNIDPLFQVDLDALTTGDGLYFTLGRFAVRVHRFILSIVLDLPKSILQSVLSFVWSFVQTPPVFFLMAVLIRHGLGKVVLGAKLPAAVVDDAAHKDILSTVQTFATKFVLSSFPTLKIVYDVWTHIRSDMYVILCGLFVGWAVSHSHLAGSPYGDASRSDGATTTLNGISDEL